MTLSRYLLALALGVMVSGCAPKYGTVYKSHWGAHRPTACGGNYENSGVMMAYGGKPISFAWQGDQLWILWEEKSGFYEKPEYHIIPHPVDRGVFEIAIFDSGDWDKYQKWICSGAPRSWEAYWDSHRKEWVRIEP